MEHKIQMQMLWGDCLKGLKNYKSAMAMYQGITNRGDEWQNIASFQTAWCLLKIGRFSEAISWLQELNDDYSLKERVLVCKWICFQQFGLTNLVKEEQSKIYIDLMCILTIRMDAWIYHLCKLFEDFREYFDELALPLFQSILTIEKPEVNGSNIEEIEREICDEWHEWNLTRNSFHITGFFKKQIVRAKNK